MLTQRCLLPLLTSTVKSSLFTHVHSSPCSLAARLQGCHVTILIILTIVGLFLDKLHTYKYTYKVCKGYLLKFIQEKCLSGMFKMFKMLCLLSGIENLRVRQIFHSVFFVCIHVINCSLFLIQMRINKC